MPKKCENCKQKLATYAIAKNQPRILCGKCKSPNHVFVAAKLCEDPVCTKQANYGLPGQKAQYCKTHKPSDEYSNVVNPCKVCGKTASYGKKGTKKAEYCAEHAPKDGSYTDVLNKKCKHCDTQASFGKIGTKLKEYCAKHAPTDGSYEDIKHPKCKQEHCGTKANNKYDDYCAFCFCNLFPDNPKTRNYKTKEKLFYDFVMQTYGEVYTIQYNVKTTCSGKIPDFVVHFGDYIAVIEFDEDQHKSYPEICENKRKMELMQDFGFLPIIFIRFNPDSYKDKNGKKVKSCFSIDERSGLIRLTNENEWKRRLEIFCFEFEALVSKKPEQEVTTKELFYDEYYG